MSKSQQQNIVLRTLSYSLLIIVISLACFFGHMPVVSDYLHDIESKTYDLLFITRYYLGLDPKPPKNILIVGIDAGSIKKVGVPWPWPRQFHGSLVDALKSAGAKYIVFDIIFDTISPLSLQTQDVVGDQTVSESSFDAGSEDDGIFAMSINEAMNVFLSCEAEPLSKTDYQAILPIDTYLEALNNDVSFLGNASVTYDSDNFIRKSKLIFPEFYKDPAVTASTAFRVAQKYLKERARIQSDYSIKLGMTLVPQEILINFYGQSETIKTIPYWKALELIYQNKGDIFKDKVVYIGRTKLKASIDPFKSVRSPDSFPTPYSVLTPNFSGVEIQATILGNLIESLFIRRVNEISLILIFSFVAIFTTLLVFRFRTKLIFCFFLCLLFALLYIVNAFILFAFGRISIPPTFPVYGMIVPIYFVNLIDQYFIVDRARRRQAKIFRQLVPPQVADEIEKMGQDELALGGSKREITVLFTDIKSFTPLCERNTPEVIVNILNHYFTEMVKVIHKHNGLVDKFIGDAIMAFWGAPKALELSVQANSSARCALDMKQQLNLLNEKWKELVGASEIINIRIGLNTDVAITGNVGSLERMQFSAIGDGVNVASRLEAVNKVYGTSIILSASTAKLLDRDLNIRELDRVIVPGKDVPVDIYELIESENFTPELYGLYGAGLDNYRQRDFDKAIKFWKECLNLNSHDKPSEIMLKRAMKFKETPPPDDWNTVWIVDTK